MNHNGTKPSPTVPSQDWIDYAAAQEQQQQQGDKEVHPAAAVAAATPGSTAALLQYSSPDAFIDRLKAKSSRRTSPSHGHKGHHSKQHHHQHQHQSVQQRDADLVPLAVAAEHAPCPRRRAAAAAALRKATAARQSLEAAARGAVAGLLKQPAAGHVLITRLGWNPAQVLMLQGTAGTVGSASHQQQQQQQRLGESSLAVGDAVESYVEALMGPLPHTAAAGGALVGDWSCLRSMVQVRDT
jgi:hypothetical protein